MGLFFRGAPPPLAEDRLAALVVVAESEVVLLTLRPRLTEAEAVRLTMARFGSPLARLALSEVVRRTGVRLGLSFVSCSVVKELSPALLLVLLGLLSDFLCFLGVAGSSSMDLLSSGLSSPPLLLVVRL